jgi:drug/metabolite transporter (DMT)-like permease
MTALRWLGIFKMDFKGKDIRPLILCGLLVPSIGFFCEFYSIGQGWVTTGQVALFYAMSPVLITVLGVLILKEKPSRRQYACMAVSVCGLMIINLGTNFETSHPLGMVLPAVAVLCSGFNSILMRRIGGAFSPVETVYVTTSVGMCFYSLLSVGGHLIKGTLHSYLDGVFTFPFIIGILYLSVISSTIGFSLINYTLTQLPPVVSSSFSGFSTILTITVGVWLLNETFSLKSAVGCALILAGALLMNAGYRPPATQDEAAQLTTQTDATL